jgi:hypothetical protein
LEISSVNLDAIFFRIVELLHRGFKQEDGNLLLPQFGDDGALTFTALDEAMDQDFSESGIIEIAFSLHNSRHFRMMLS